MRISTHIRKPQEKQLKELRKQISWSDLVSAVISLWFSDLRFKRAVEKFNKGRKKENGQKERS